jgi:hypothetical protein
MRAWPQWLCGVPLILLMPVAQPEEPPRRIPATLRRTSGEDRRLPRSPLPIFGQATPGRQISIQRPHSRSD